MRSHSQGPGGREEQAEGSEDVDRLPEVSVLFKDEGKSVQAEETGEVVAMLRTVARHAGLLAIISFWDPLYHSLKYNRIRIAQHHFLL